MRLERNLLIPLPDGTTLAADLSLPDAREPVPALVSYTPYGKGDIAAAEVERPSAYFAERGFASLLVDFRGFGDSSGRAGGRERGDGGDGAEIVAWAACQPWCDGNVGMWGVSASAVSAFATAAAQPPHLRAAVMIMGFPDAGEWILPGGTRLCLVLADWAAYRLALHLMPPRHRDSRGRWRTIWRSRLEESEPYMLRWLRAEVDDPLWRTSRAISEIATPTFLIGGWRDLCSEGIVNAYSQIRAPRKLLMGPWGHVAPDAAPRAPVDYLSEMCTWWGRWLRSDGNSAGADRPVTVFDLASGAWRSESSWPPPAARERVWWLGENGRLDTSSSAGAAELDYVADPTVGIGSGRWEWTGSPLDQGEDDLRSLVFTSEPLAETLEIAGAPRAALFVSLVEGEEANIVVRLCDVSPRGRSELITSGWLRHVAPGGQVVELDVPLWATAYSLVPGHRLRLAVSCADFPHIWPTLTNPRVRVFLSGTRASSVALPVLPSGEQAVTVSLADPQRHEAEPSAGLESAPLRRVERDLVADAVSATLGDRTVLVPASQEGRLRLVRRSRAVVSAAKPETARVDVEVKSSIVSPAGDIAKITVRGSVAATGFVLHGRIKLDGRLLFAKTWHG
jgi:hypothetical protein